MPRAKTGIARQSRTGRALRKNEEADLEVRGPEESEAARMRRAISVVAAEVSESESVPAARSFCSSASWSW
jgi:hypothetical protein